jgi:trigger factor
VEVDAGKDERCYKKRRGAKIFAARKHSRASARARRPIDIVVRTYGEAAITEQAVDMFIDAEYSNILKEADVNPGAAQVSLENIESLDPPNSSSVCRSRRRSILAITLSVRMPYEWQAPEQKDVDAALEDLRQMYASTETVERASNREIMCSLMFQL